MAVIITPQIEIDYYFNSDALNQSSLKDLMKGFDYFVNKQNSPKRDTIPEYFIVGSAVDTILTGEDGNFDKLFYVLESSKKPSDLEVSITKTIFERYYTQQSQKSLYEFSDEILEVVDEFNWQTRWKSQTRVDKIIEVCSDYFEELKQSYGKTIVTAEQKQTIDNIVTSLINSETTKKYFDRDFYKNSDNFDIYYQLPIYFTYKNVKCKALLDILIIEKDNSGNIINVLPIDLKTIWDNTVNFLYSFKTHGYHIQCAWYTEALLNSTSSFKLLHGIDKKIVSDFKFIVESSKNPKTPIVYTVDKLTYELGKFGREAIFATGAIANTYPRIQIAPAVIGFDSLVENYIYYTHQNWLMEKVIFENNAELTLTWDGIIE